MEPSKSNTKTEEDYALKEKRARRVSFADNEITSVHVFRRDDDASSDPSDAPSNPSFLRFFGELASHSDDDQQPQLDNETGNSFLRSIDFPSPGGSSTANDDDDDFRGPVSARFIKREQLLDSAGDYDDVTMDSTAFSLHYRSIARSDSGDINSRQLCLTSSSSPRSSMDFTEAKRLCEEVLDAESASRDSNEMSIEGEHQRSYQFDTVSPAFDAPLAEEAVKGSPQRNLDGSVASPVARLHQIHPSDSSTKEIKEFTEEATVAVCRQLDFENRNWGTPLKVDEDRRQVVDSNKRSTRKQLSLSSLDSLRRTGNITPRVEQSGLLGPEISIAYDATPSYEHRSISKIKTFESTPTMLNLKEGMNILKAKLSEYSPGFSLSNKKALEYKQDESRQTPLPQEKLFSLTLERNKRNDLVDSNYHGIRSFENNCKSCQNVKNLDTKPDEENLILISADVSCNDESLKAVELEVSPSQMPCLTKVVDVNLADSTVEKGEDEILVPSPPIPEVTTLLHSLQDASKGNLDGHGHDNCYHSVLQVAQSSLTKSGIVISSGKKRKGVEVLVNGDNIDKIGRIDRSPEVHTRGNGDVQLEQTDSLRREREKLGDETWNDEDLILKNFLDGTNQLLPPLVDKLNLRLHTTTDPLAIHKDKRIVETRMLLYDIAYEKAKLQLLNVKRDKLLKKLQQLSSGLQECEMIKLKFNIPSTSKSGTMDTQADDGHIRSKFSSKGRCQVCCGEVLETKQDLETLGSRAKALSELLYEHCKMEGDQSYTKIMKAVSDYLQKRMPCKSLLQNMKLWEIEDFERTDDCYRVGLNYCGYITQRFTANTGQSNIILSNSLNSVTIEKNFPNLDAFSAFVFVLNPHTTKKGSGSSSMARETQITSSLLSNLLDVVEEVQSARIVLKNLVEAKFYSHSVQRLDLQLSFIDFYSGRKVKVTFDITCLKCGVYPAEVLPSQIYDPSSSSGEQKSLPSSLVDEIRTATESVRVGYSRIIRLCRCISQAVHACNKSK
ncbi:uncharacterized protein LOC114166259 isoform X2 [Vigna unguiculata]|uniref:uncharacterized protein LOC114166259 isoform X2 n=1 Tax=Vigna unguiculata TaxID=3917 RepID=UPI001016F590|nr:uncharacterized protein LOC114166259 isoform X2 [Vigna unguiculata]